MAYSRCIVKCGCLQSYLLCMLKRILGGGGGQFLNADLLVASREDLHKTSMSLVQCNCRSFFKQSYS